MQVSISCLSSIIMRARPRVKEGSGPGNDARPRAIHLACYLWQISSRVRAASRIKCQMTTIWQIKGILGRRRVIAKEQSFVAFKIS